MDVRGLQQLRVSAINAPLTPVDPGDIGAVNYQLLAVSSWPGSLVLADKAPITHTDLYRNVPLPPRGEA